MIRKATASDIQAILQITSACSDELIRNGIYQWSEEYPNELIFLKDIERQRLFVIEHKGIIIGSISLLDEMHNAYSSVEWLTPNKKNLYVHRLAVHPDCQGKGFARKLMDFAEKYAKDHNYISIRLDTFSQNKRNQKFYEQRNYTKLEDTYFPDQSEFPFHCYERVL